MENISETTYASYDPYKFLMKDKSKKKPPKLTQKQIFEMSNSKKITKKKKT
jgi:hypothetical protein